MSGLATMILTAIRDENFVFGAHALERLRQRKIPLWQVAACCASGKVLREQASARPNPKVEMEIVLPDGTTAKAVWSWLAVQRRAKLVTVHFVDR
jgi:hypothetical protein